jgi:hypothetical protein
MSDVEYIYNIIVNLCIIYIHTRYIEEAEKEERAYQQTDKYIQNI